MKEPELKNTAEIVLRNHLLRCFKDVVKEFPTISHMPKEEAVDYLLRLLQDGKVISKLNTGEKMHGHPRSYLKCRLRPPFLSFNLWTALTITWFLFRC